MDVGVLAFLEFGINASQVSESGESRLLKA